MTANKQFANVGNLGDILKHAALTSLVQLLHTRGGRLLSVDTHAFLLEAPCPDPSRWLVEAQRECSHHPEFGSYIEHQRHVGDTPSRYRCSSGLVLDVSRAVGPGNPALILAECDRDTKARLKEQLKIEHVEPHAVLDDARELSAVAVPDADVPLTESLPTPVARVPQPDDTPDEPPSAVRSGPAKPSRRGRRRTSATTTPKSGHRRDRPR